MRSLYLPYGKKQIFNSSTRMAIYNLGNKVALKPYIGLLRLHYHYEEKTP